MKTASSIMTQNHKVDLYALLKSLQSQLAAGLQVREVLDHPEAKGTASELDWKGMLSQYLPLRYRVSKAFVIDSVGERSDQLDIVVHDRQYSPLLFEHSGAMYIPAESVYAVFEVKQTVGKDEISYAGKKAGSVRRLKRTSSSIKHAGGRFPAKAPLRILAGVVALDVKMEVRDKHEAEGLPRRASSGRTLGSRLYCSRRRFRGPVPPSGVQSSRDQRTQYRSRVLPTAFVVAASEARDSARNRR